ncbi:MAG: hypothetical protein R3B54_04965 [Bdellovibrionota bacterium]
MKASQTISFLFAVVLVGLILHFAPFNEGRVAAHRLERAWSQEGAGMRALLRNQCDVLSTKNDTQYERLFLGWLAMDSLETGEAQRKCDLVVHQEHSTRFDLRTLWVVSVQVQRDGQLLLLRSFSVDTPRPLSFLPVVVFVLALFFEFRLWKFSVMLVSYLFMLSGGNLIRMVDLIGHSVYVALTADQTLIGLGMVVFWLSIQQVRGQHESPLPVEQKPHESWLNRALATLTGLWNPIAFTLFGKVMVPNRSGWIFPFLEAQFVFTAVSLYLLTIHFGNLRSLFKESLLLPRYFTFAVLFLYAIHLWLKPARKQRLAWKIPNFWRAVVILALIEIARQFVPALQGLNSVTRFGMALMLGELVWPKDLHLKASFNVCYPWLSVLFMGVFIMVVSVESGVIDLALELFNPRAHPRVLYLFTFLAGMGLGFLTGSFSAAFFSLFAYMQSPQVPLIKAAILDGVLAGLMLSPLSLFNLLPAIQFRIGVRKLISFRLSQLAIPLLIGVTIYSVAAVTSVDILQPVTFVFCLLLAFGYTLKRAAWSVRKNRSLLASSNQI